LFRSYILKFYVISKPLFVLFDLIKYPDLDSVCTCLWVDGASVGTQKEGKMYRKRGGLRECLTIPSTNSNVNRVRVHPLLASETNEGYTCLQSACWFCSHLPKCSCKGICYTQDAALF